MNVINTEEQKIIYDEPWKIVSENNRIYSERIKDYYSDYALKMQLKLSDEKNLETMWSKMISSKGCYIGAMKSPSGTLFWNSLSEPVLNNGVPEINFDLKQKNIIAQSKHLKARFLSENSLNEIISIHGECESDIFDSFLEQIAIEIDHELFFNMLHICAENNFIYNSDIKNIKETVIRAASAIYSRTHNSDKVTVFSESKEICKIINTQIITNFIKIEAEHSPFLPKEKIILAQRGKSFLSPSILMNIYSIYLCKSSNPNDSLHSIIRSKIEIIQPKAFHVIEII